MVAYKHTAGRTRHVPEIPSGRVHTLLSACEWKTSTVSEKRLQDGESSGHAHDTSAGLPHVFLKDRDHESRLQVVPGSGGPETAIVPPSSHQHCPSLSRPSRSGAIGQSIAPGTRPLSRHNTSHWLLEHLASDPNLEQLGQVFAPLGLHRSRKTQNTVRLSFDQTAQRQVFWEMLWTRGLWNPTLNRSGDERVGCEEVRSFLDALNQARLLGSTSSSRGSLVKNIARIVTGHTPQESGQIAARCGLSTFSSEGGPLLVNIDVGMTQDHYNFGVAYLHQVAEAGTDIVFARAPIGEVLLFFEKEHHLLKSPAQQATLLHQTFLEHKDALTTAERALPFRNHQLTQSAMRMMFSAFPQVRSGMGPCSVL